jgi:hypothetical protein
MRTCPYVKEFSHPEEEHMQTFYTKRKTFLIMMELLVFMWVLSGCAFLGSRAIKTGRNDYNQAITYTEGQQILLNILRNRYGEITTTLSVSGIAANAKVRTGAGINLGFGTPVQGMEAIQQLTSPIPLDIVVPLANSMMYESPIMSMVIRRLNRVDNPAYLQTAAAEPDPQYAQVIDMMSGLKRAGKLFWGKLLMVGEGEEETQIAFIIRDYEPDYSTTVYELLRLLNVPKPKGKSKDIIVKTVLAFEQTEPMSVAVLTRSVIDIMELLAAAVDVPEEDQISGAAIQFPKAGLPGKDIEIRRSEDKPKKASISVKYRGYWFYVDDTDQVTKQALRLLQFLNSAMTGEAASKGHVRPALTIPISQ